MNNVIAILLSISIFILMWCIEVFSVMIKNIEFYEKQLGKSDKNIMEKITKWLFISAFMLIAISLILFTCKYIK